MANDTVAAFNGNADLAATKDNTIFQQSTGIGSDPITFLKENQTGLEVGAGALVLGAFALGMFSSKGVTLPLQKVRAKRDWNKP